MLTYPNLALIPWVHVYVTEPVWLLRRRYAVGGGGGFPAGGGDPCAGGRNFDYLPNSDSAGQYGGSITLSQNGSGMHLHNWINDDHG